MKTSHNHPGLWAFCLHTDANFKLGKGLLLKDPERFRKKKRVDSPSEQSQVAALTSCFVEETRQVRFFDLPSGCRWVQKEKEKGRPKKVN